MGFGKDGKGAIIREVATITIGALAAGAAVKHTGGAVLQTTSFRILKTKYFLVMSTAFQGEFDQVLIGMANGALSVTEIAESISSNGPDDRNDRAGMETAERAVFLVAQMREPSAQANGINEAIGDNLALNENFRWTFTPTEGWDWFAFNPLGGAITTGAVVKIFAKHYGVWVD